MSLLAWGETGSDILRPPGGILRFMEATCTQLWPCREGLVPWPANSFICRFQHPQRWVDPGMELPVLLEREHGTVPKQQSQTAGISSCTCSPDRPITPNRWLYESSGHMVFGEPHLRSHETCFLSVFQQHALLIIDLEWGRHRESRK